MKKILDLIADEVKKSFHLCGYDTVYAKVTISNRPDLCEYQCNGALAAAKEYKKAPIGIAKEVVDNLGNSDILCEITAVMPGFINMRINPEFLAKYLTGMSREEMLGCEKTDDPETIIIDYGGANVAKPLHVGHLRSAIIGETMKRIGRFLGHRIIGDVHLGDWGLQMGLIITELKRCNPDLVYFNPVFEGEYPSTPPFTISELEQIYPAASGRAKTDTSYREEAQIATLELQNGRKGYHALWRHIMNVSLEDLKKNYNNLNVSFDLWKGESDAQQYIPDMLEKFVKNGLAYESQGALVIDIQQEGDAKELPPCIVRKTDGAALYATSDLATIIEREKLYQPDRYLYLADKRQELHFTQVFRAAKKTGLVDSSTSFTFLGFGTMNGKDGKPFKTRDGGVMRLEELISIINEKVYEKIEKNRDFTEEETRAISKIVGLSALKYGDLSNQAAKDYIFDMDRFTSFEGNTGPYVLYTIVRIKSILIKYEKMGYNNSSELTLHPAASESERTLMLELVNLNEIIEASFTETAPHKICQYIYDLSDATNKFYHETKILIEEDKKKQASWIALISLTKDILVCCIQLLGFDAPDRM